MTGSCGCHDQTLGCQDRTLGCQEWTPAANTGFLAAKTGSLEIGSLAARTGSELSMSSDLKSSVGRRHEVEEELVGAAREDQLRGANRLTLKMMLRWPPPPGHMPQARVREVPEPPELID